MPDPLTFAECAAHPPTVGEKVRLEGTRGHLTHARIIGWGVHLGALAWLSVKVTADSETHARGDVLNSDPRWTHPARNCRTVRGHVRVTPVAWILPQEAPPRPVGQ